MNRIKLLLLIAMTIIILPGCWDVNEPELVYYVNGIGIDYKDGKYEVYAEFINFANTAKSDQPAPIDQSQSEVGFATGSTMDTAVFELYRSIGEKVFWGHLSYLVVSEEAMKNVKLSPVIDDFIRFRETRYQIWVYTTKDPLDDFLLVRPLLNKSVTLSMLNEPKSSFDQDSYIKPVNLRNLIINMNEPSHEALIPLVSIQENWKSIKGPIKAHQLSGVGIVTPNGFKGFIEDDKVRGLQWMSNDFKRGQITIKLDKSDHLTVIIEKVKVKVKPIIETDTVKFDIDLKFDASITSIEGKATVDEIRKAIVKQIKKEIEATYEEGLDKDADIYRLSEHLYRKNLKEWKKHEKNGKVELTKDSIRNLNMEIRKLDSDRKSYKETIEP